LDGFIVKSINYGHIVGFLPKVQRSCGRLNLKFEFFNCELWVDTLLSVLTLVK